MLYKQMIKIRDIVSFLIESCHWATYFTILQMISLLLGCSNTLSTNDDWVEQLTALKEGNSIFSFGFNAPPPEGIMIKLSIFRNNIKKPCDIFDLQREEEMSGDFWYINILVDMTNVGEYLIDPLMNEYHQDASSVTLEQVREWKTYRRYPAVRGTVVIKAAPSSLEEWNNGMKLEAEIVAEFPTSPMHEIECFAEGDSEQLRIAYTNWVGNRPYVKNVLEPKPDALWAQSTTYQMRR